DGAVGEGMRQRAMEAEAVIGAGLGIRDGSLYKHNLALSELRFGRIVSRVLGQGCWYQGNFEFLGELFVGSQISPSPRYFVGFAPGIRYEFATGTRWVPFIDGSAGVVGTDIGHPDLGANFEFSLQGGSGVKYYFRDNAAFIFQYRYLHFSNGGLYIHNKGINVNVLLIGASWSF
ncbi:MAG TPA: acyloxyacyl hydrolase, partial [Verrucomicrobiae bacterium]|nr:acyloxyacyl hydrolase [Verrucomicrobiae bacterium]